MKRVDEHNELRKSSAFDIRIHMGDIDLDLLRCFATVAELRNFTASGARLGRSQSAVSIRVKKLEDTLGTQLFVRNNQDVLLTESGKKLLPKARRMLEESERLMAEMRVPSISGKLRIGLLEYIAPHRLPDIMTAMQRKLPGAELQFLVGLSSNLKTALSKGVVDLALALHDPGTDASTVIAEDKLIWVESENNHRHANSDRLDLCLMQAPCIYRKNALESLALLGLKYREVMTGNSVQAVQNAVRSGLGFTVLGSSCLGYGLKPAHHLEENVKLPAVGLSLYGNDPRKADVARLLQDVLRTHLDNAIYDYR